MSERTAAIADVALEVGLPPEGDRRRKRDQRQRGGDLPEARRGSRSLRHHASTCLQRPAVDHAAGLEPHHPVAQPPRLLGVVGDEDERDLRARAAAPPASPRSRRGRRGRGPRSARRAAARRAAGPAPGPASPAAARRPRAWRRRGRRTRGRGRRGAGSAPASSSLAGEAGGVAEVRLDRPLQQRRQLRDQRDLAPQRQRVVARRAARPR